MSEEIQETVQNPAEPVSQAAAGPEAPAEQKPKEERKRFHWWTPLWIVERDFLNTLCQSVTPEVVHTRLSYLLEWYSRKAQRNKHCYNITRIFSYAIPCVISLISVYAAGQDKPEAVKAAVTATAALSALLVALHHLIDHYRYYENWIRYRRSAELLKEQAELYLNRSRPYNSKNSEKNALQLAQNIEAVAKDELKEWVSLRWESHQTLSQDNQSAIHTAEHSSAAGAAAQEAEQPEESPEAEAQTEPVAEPEEPAAE